MKAIERLSKAISAAEEELDEIDRVIDPLTDEKQAALSRITADLLSGVIDDAEAAKLREQAELELDRLVRQRRATLRSALPELQARLVAEQEAERLATVERLRGEARHALANREQALRRLRHRALVAATVDAVTPLLADDDELGPRPG